jgi:hypothetical protein
LAGRPHHQAVIDRFTAMRADHYGSLGLRAKMQPMPSMLLMHMTVVLIVIVTMVAGFALLGRVLLNAGRMLWLYIAAGLITVVGCWLLLELVKA